MFYFFNYEIAISKKKLENVNTFIYCVIELINSKWLNSAKILYTICYPAMHNLNTNMQTNICQQKFQLDCWQKNIFIYLSNT